MRCSDREEGPLTRALCIRLCPCFARLTAVRLSQNNPLLLRVYAESNDILKFHFIVHASLDMIDDTKGVSWPMLARDDGQTYTQN